MKNSTYRVVHQKRNRRVFCLYDNFFEKRMDLSIFWVLSIAPLQNSYAVVENIFKF